MTFLKYTQTISRNDKGKKIYDNKLTPTLPEDWQNKTSDYTLEEVVDGTTNYLIRPDDDLVVIDCDTKKHTKKLLKLAKKTDYIVMSDNGTAHFYYKVPKGFFTKSRKRLVNAIDILIGKSLVFTPNKYNKTKAVKQGSLDKLTKMPKKILRYLESLLPDEPDNTNTYSKTNNILHYMLKDDIEEKMTLYRDTGNFNYLYNLFDILTPSKYRQYVEPTLHPDRIPQGMGIMYLQALSAKLAGDISVSPELHKEFITLIARELWSDQLPKPQLRAFLSNLTTQTYPDGSPVFVYDPDATKNTILLSENKSPLYPIYRTIDDRYLFISDDKVSVAPSFTALKRMAQSKNIKALLNGREIREIKGDHISAMLTLELIEDKSKERGLTMDNYRYYYNTNTNPDELDMLLFHKPTLNKSRVVRAAKGYNSYKDAKQPILNIDWSDMPTIHDLLHNITYDHKIDDSDEQDIVISNLLMFLARKLTTLDYSPIVIQLLGAMGTGKSMFLNMLDQLTGGVKEVVLESNFNAEYAQALFLYEDEGTMSYKVTNRVKQLSGNATMRIEGKGVNATYERNLSTIVVNSNLYKTMAQHINDRRFVSLCSFNAPRLSIDNIDMKIKEEIRPFAELLLEISRLDKIKQHTNRLYMDAVYWADTQTKLLILDQSASKVDDAVEGKEALLAYTLNNYEDLDASTINDNLDKVFGYGYSLLITRDNKVYVPIASNISKVTYEGRELPNSMLSKKNLAKHNISVKSFFTDNTGKRSRRNNHILLPNELVSKIKDYIIIKSRVLRGMKYFEYIKDLS